MSGYTVADHVPRDDVPDLLAALTRVLGSRPAH